MIFLTDFSVGQKVNKTTTRSHSTLKNMQVKQPVTIRIPFVMWISCYLQFLVCYWYTQALHWYNINFSLIGTNHIKSH